MNVAAIGNGIAIDSKSLSDSELVSVADATSVASIRNAALDELAQRHVGSPTIDMTRPQVASSTIIPTWYGPGPTHHPYDQYPTTAPYPTTTNNLILGRDPVDTADKIVNAIMNLPAIEWLKIPNEVQSWARKKYSEINQSDTE